MACSNCTANEYAEWVDRIAEIEVEIQDHYTAISNLNSEKSGLQSQKAQCDGQGGPP